MPVPHAVILHSGGLRSLVATALLQREASSQKRRITLLHVVDGRDDAAVRLEYTHLQAEHFQIGRVSELDLPHLYGHGHGKQPDGQPMGPFATPQLLLAALAQARLQQAERLVWPVSVNGQTNAMARATERVVLVDHLARLEGEPQPRIDTPLLELTDQQIIELGEQLGVPWHAAWSCLVGGESPCRACVACRRRKLAFDKAGVVDPIESTTRGRPAAR